MQEEEEKYNGDGKEEKMAQQPQELQHLELVLHPLRVQGSLAALQLLHLELRYLIALDTRDLWQLKHRIFQK